MIHNKLGNFCCPWPKGKGKGRWMRKKNKCTGMKFVQRNKKAYLQWKWDDKLQWGTGEATDLPDSQKREGTIACHEIFLNSILWARTKTQKLKNGEPQPKSQRFKSKFINSLCPLSTNQGHVFKEQVQQKEWTKFMGTITPWASSGLNPVPIQGKENKPRVQIGCTVDWFYKLRINFCSNWTWRYIDCLQTLEIYRLMAPNLLIYWMKEHIKLAKSPQPTRVVITCMVQKHIISPGVKFNVLVVD